MGGYSGLEDELDNHWKELLGAAALSTLLGVGSELGSGADNGSNTAVLQALRLGAANSANFLENLKRVPAFQEPKVSFSACGGGGAGLQLYCFNLSFIFSTLDRTQPGAAAPPPAKAGATAGAAGM